MKRHSISFTFIRCLSFLIFFVWLSPNSSSQSINFCGELTTNEAYSTHPDSIVYDRFGNTYDRYITEEVYGSELIVRSLVGYFDLRFDIDDIDPDLTPVIEDVFEYLSSLIDQRVNIAGCDEEVEVSPVVIVIQSADLPNGVLAAASPMYLNGTNNSCDEVNANLVDLKINGGLPGQNNIDGKIEISDNITPFTWNVDAGNASTNEADVYSVIIHEALHLFGIASLLGSSGNSTNGFLTVWDQFLYTTTLYVDGGPSLNMKSLLSSDCEENCWVLNSELFDNAGEFTTALGDHCDVSGSLDFVFGEDAIAPLDGTSSSVQSALSHLNKTCNGQNVNYVMQPGLNVPNGETRRNITAAEKDILCTLGYKVETCDMCYLTALPEHVNLQFFNTCCESVITLCEDQLNTISHDLLLCNDFGGEEVEITDYFLPGSSPLTVTNTGTAFEITPSQQGRHTLYYTVKNCECRMLNSYVVFDVGPCTDCEEIDPCESLVCVNDFEEYATGFGLFSINIETAGTHWIANGDNSLDICEETGGNNYLHIGSHSSNREGLIMKLSEPLMLGCTLHVTFDASVSEGNVFSWYVSEYPPCNYLESFVSYDGDPSDCGTHIFDPDLIDDIPILNVTGSETLCVADAMLEPAMEIHWPNKFGEVNYLILFPGPKNTNFNHNYIDNIVVTKDCIDASFDYELVGECLEINFNSLDDNSENAHEWDFGDSNSSSSIDPTHTYSTPGTFTVTHTVTDECGNSETVVHEVATGDCCADLLITTNTNWPNQGSVPSNGIFNTLTIQHGYSLNIGPNVVIKFCPGGAMIIEDGAFVRNKGDLISLTDVSWKGIYVEGLGPTVSQQNNCSLYSTSVGCSPQGSYWGDEGSLIENAVIGVRSYGPGFGTTGGKIRANEAIFRNNATALHFDSYQNFSNISGKPIPTLATFTDCTFSTTSTYPIDKEFIEFVRLDDVDGMRFVGCTFDSDYLPDMYSDFEDFGKGIHATGSAFSAVAHVVSPNPPEPCDLEDCYVVSNTTFDGLAHGILVENATAVRPYTITQCIFENCNRGITSDFSTGGTILYNDFLFGATPSTLFPDQIGIYLDDDHSGFELQENNFVYSGTTNSIGILCKGLGGAPNVIRKNNFHGLFIAHEAFMQNAINSELNSNGLIYLCDTIENTQEKGFDFYVPDASVLDNIYRLQAELTDNPGVILPAGNNFAYSATDLHNPNILNPNWNFQEWFYYLYYNSGNQNPLTSDIGYSKDDLLSANGCAVEHCAPPCIAIDDLDDIKDDYYIHLAAKNDKIDEYWAAIAEEDEDAAHDADLLVTYYGRKAFKTAYTVVSHIWLDTVNFHIDTLIKWYGNLDTYGSDIMIAGELARAGRMNDALDALTDISSNRDLTPLQEEDLANIIDIYSILETTEIMDLTANDKRVVRNIAQSNIGTSSGIAKAILSYHGENHARPYYLGELNDPPIRYRTEETGKSLIVKTSNLEIYPIPSSDDVNLSWLKSDTTNLEADLKIIDLFGRSIASMKIASKSPITINVSSWNPGIYIAVVQDQYGLPQSKLFIVN